MKFVSGRDNLSVTVYVPWNCSNTCKFCSSKDEYKKGTDIEKVKKQLYKIRNSSIKEVVFTGGEPMMNVEELMDLINIVDNKKVYINTTFINKDAVKFVKLVNGANCIKAVNISRHTTSYEEDSKLLKNIAQDELIQFIDKPVKINVVIPEEIIKGNFVLDVINRWKAFENVSICFRANFNNMSLEKLHDLSDLNLEVFSDYGVFIRRSFCDVCDTITYGYGEKEFMYHRGLPTTSTYFSNVIQVNDIILFPDGELAYDWNRETDGIEDLCEQFGFNKTKTLSKSIEQQMRERIVKSKSTPDISYGSCGAYRRHC